MPFGRITYSRRFLKTGALVASSVDRVGHKRDFCLGQHHLHLGCSLAEQGAEAQCVVYRFVRW